MYLMQVDPQSSAILGTIKVDDIICRGERNSLLPQQGYKKLSVYGTWKKKKKELVRSIEWTGKSIPMGQAPTSDRLELHHCK